MIRTIPSTGRVLSFADEQSVKETLNMGCWSEQQFIGKDKEWFAERITMIAQNLLYSITVKKLLK